MQAVLLRLLEDMFPEGQGRPSAKAKLDAITAMTNGLFKNTKTAVCAMFTARGYDPRRPEYVKEKLGYALDQYEAIACVSLRSIGYPLLGLEERRVIGKRCKNLLSPLEKKLKELILSPEAVHLTTDFATVSGLAQNLAELRALGFAAEAKRSAADEPLGKDAQSSVKTVAAIVAAFAALCSERNNDHYCKQALDRLEKGGEIAKCPEELVKRLRIACGGT